MAAYFDRVRVVQNGIDFYEVPGNVKSSTYMWDNKLVAVNGFSQNHQISGYICGNGEGSVVITVNLQSDKAPIDYQAIDFDNNPMSLQLIIPKSNYGSDVYAKSSTFLIPNVRFGSQSNDTPNEGTAATITYHFLCPTPGRWL